MIIKNARMMDPVTGLDERGALLLTDGRIQRILKADEEQEIEELCKTNEVIDARGAVTAPGLWDVHVHFRDPGFTYKEDIFTGAGVAAAGGFTTVVMMANTKPAIDSVETLDEVLRRAGKTKIHVLSCGTISKGLKGEELTDMPLLKEHGAVGFTDDGIPLKDAEFVKQAMEMAVAVGLPLSFHEEDPAYISQSGINHGAASRYYGIEGADRQAEISMIERDIALAKETGAVIDVQHISSAEGVELIRQARQDGFLNIHAEATPHHFSLTEEAAIEKGTLAKMNPPLRTEADRQAIIRGLKDKTIEIIATDHAPHAPEEKAKELLAAPSGILGLETALPLAIRSLVEPGYMTLLEVLDRMIVGPQVLYGFKPHGITEGAPADLVIFDPKETFVYGKSLSKSQNSPFLKETLPGKIIATLVGGKVVYHG